MGFCEWDPRAGRSLIAQGAHCLCHDGCRVERVTSPRFLTRVTPTGIPHHSDVGGPGDLLVLEGSLICVHCVMDSISISYI